MTNSPDLNLLIARLKEATGGDRELDLAIGLAIDGWRMHPGTPDAVYDHEGSLYSSRPGGMYASFTESVDEALALVERKLPGCCALMNITPKKTLVNLASKPLGEVGAWFPIAEAKTAPLAILAALLSALAAAPAQEVVAE